MHGGDFNSSSQTTEPVAVLLGMLKHLKQLHLQHQLLHVDQFMKEERHNVMDGLFYTKGEGM